MLIVKPPPFLGYHLSNAPVHVIPDGAKEQHIQSIAVIGGTIKNEKLSDFDGFVLSAIFDICAQIGISVDRSPQIGAVNLHYGHDFLDSKELIETDMVVFSSVYFNKNSINMQPAEFEEGSIEALARQSPHAGSEELWHSSLLRTKARIAFNILGSGTLPTAFLNRSPFEHKGTFKTEWLRSKIDLLMR